MTSDIKTSKILNKALNDLKSLYREEGFEPGNLIRLAVKPQWNVLIGSKKQCGISMNYTGIHSVYGKLDKQEYINYIKTLVGKPLFEIAEETINTDDIHKRSIGLAALNALSGPLIIGDRLYEKGYRSDKAIKDFTRPTDVITIVGYGGMVKEFLGKSKELHVTDIRPKEFFETIIVGDKIEHGPRDVILHGAEENEEVLSRSDVVLITGSTLMNGTFDDLVSYAKNARIISIYGPSAQLLPDSLFDSGVNVIQSVMIEDTMKLQYDMYNELDMEIALRMHQYRYTLYKE
ncbi:hypothetical protein CUJ83_02490 [Methanocella sp. CWC-04]|uniref:Heavy-metal chelation domain-containing protein n=1 Tax=Methanooceanicella nereidis TaxID=2052831 RepID=A0AAP2RAB4_9EURY|nr:DUF364 domain-containing protein [Methanocella sp. CWC-04]MCD1293866.1 hypothetical protein [Methanocella sp. CWC-04]